MSMLTTPRSDVHHLPPMCSVNVEVGIRISASVFVTLLFKGYCICTFMLYILMLYFDKLSHPKGLLLSHFLAKILYELL